MSHILAKFDPTLEYTCSSQVKSYGFTELMYLVMHTKEYPELNNYIKNYIDIVDVQNEQGWTAFMLACCNANMESSIETVQILFRLANIHLTTIKGTTAFMLASIECLEVVKLLLPYVDVNLQNKEGHCALMYSCMECTSIDIVAMLLDANADINMSSNAGNTALMVLCRQGGSGSDAIKIVKMLLNKGASVNKQDNYGWTALMIACRYTDEMNIPIEIIELLLNYGADVYLTTHFSKSTIDISVPRIRPLLLSYYHLKGIEELLTQEKYCKEAFDALTKLYKIEKLKTQYYERVLRGIPEQDTKIRYKIGNMGYQICKFDYDSIITNELLDYLSATPQNIQEKVRQYLSFTCC